MFLSSANTPITITQPLYQDGLLAHQEAKYLAHRKEFLPKQFSFSIHQRDFLKRILTCNQWSPIAWVFFQLWLSIKEHWFVIIFLKFITKKLCLFSLAWFLLVLKAPSFLHQFLRPFTKESYLWQQPLVLSLRSMA